MRWIRKPKISIIFDNYDLSNWEDEAREYLQEDYGEDPADAAIWSAESDLAADEWEMIYEQLKEFFEGTKKLFVDGSVGKWNGVQSGFQVFNSFKDLFCWAVKDCDYWKIYDENGHLYLTCSHHDGTNHFEIKVLTDNGCAYLNNWEYAFDDRTTSYIHEQLYKRYTRLPRYVEKQLGQ